MRKRISSAQETFFQSFNRAISSVNPVGLLILGAFMVSSFAMLVVGIVSWSILGPVGLALLVTSLIMMTAFLFSPRNREAPEEQPVVTLSDSGSPRETLKDAAA